MQHKFYLEVYKMQELLELMAEQAGGPAHAKPHLANHLGVTYAAVKKWCDRGFMPVDRAIECEYLFGIDRKTMIDSELLADVTGDVLL